MPVSPQDVYPFVHACDRVDSAMSMIDEALMSGDEQKHRAGDWIERNDYYYTFRFNNWVFNVNQREVLRDSYEDAGWPIVQIFTLDDKDTIVRLFVQPNSRYIGAALV